MKGDQIRVKAKLTEFSQHGDVDSGRDATCTSESRHLSTVNIYHINQYSCAMQNVLRHSKTKDLNYCLSNAMHSIGQSIKSLECPCVRPCVQLFFSSLPSTFPFPSPSTSPSTFLYPSLPLLLLLFLPLSLFSFPFFFPLLLLLLLFLPFFSFPLPFPFCLSLLLPIILSSPSFPPHLPRSLYFLFFTFPFPFLPLLLPFSLSLLPSFFRFHVRASNI